MSDIQPFCGLRPNSDLVHLVASPPYDVLSSKEARDMVKENPYSFLHVVKAEIDMDPKIDSHSPEVYEKSASNFQKMIANKTLLPDPNPCFYIYKLIMGDHSQYGLVVGVSVEEYENGLIKKHEHTRREKEDDRAKHVEILQANAGPVLFTYKNQETITNLIQRICSSKNPACDFIADDGVQHVLWVVDQKKDIEAIQEAFKQVPALYVADGHHRTASAYRVRNIMKENNPNHQGNEPYNHFLTVLFPDNELKIMAYNRVIQDLNGLTSKEFLEKIQEKFHLQETKDSEPKTSKTFGMFLDGKWYFLQAKEGTFSLDDPVKSLDVSILQENLLAPILGIEDPRTSTRVDFVGGIRGIKELEKRCSQDMKVAFSFYPVSVAQLMSIADSGEVMPPKSTWFEPKLRSGMVVRTL